MGTGSALKTLASSALMGASCGAGGFDPCECRVQVPWGSVCVSHRKVEQERARDRGSEGHGRRTRGTQIGIIIIIGTKSWFRDSEGIEGMP